MMNEKVTIGGRDYTDTDPRAREIIQALAAAGLSEERQARMPLRELVNVILKAEDDRGTVKADPVFPTQEFADQTNAENAIDDGLRKAARILGDESGDHDDPDDAWAMHALARVVVGRDRGEFLIGAIEEELASVGAPS